MDRLLGSALDMLQSLEKISELDDATRVYCGHEYTCTNLKFALEVVEPENVILKVINAPPPLPRVFLY
jgi:hydroxyacylglutathione hydrolase